MSKHTTNYREELRPVNTDPRQAEVMFWKTDRQPLKSVAVFPKKLLVSIRILRFRCRREKNSPAAHGGSVTRNSNLTRLEPNVVAIFPSPATSSQ